MNCKTGAVRLIDQIISTIELIDSQDYDRELELYNGSTLGKHFRHIYDFFNCLLQQCECQLVDYCQRDRDAQIESDMDYAKRSFESLKDGLQNIDEDQVITVKADFELEPGVRPVVQTSIGREVMYAYDHAVHHLAIVKIGLRDLYPDKPFDQNMGVAASTIRHQHQTH